MGRKIEIATDSTDEIEYKISSGCFLNQLFFFLVRRYKSDKRRWAFHCNRVGDTVENQNSVV